MNLMLTRRHLLAVSGASLAMLAVPARAQSDILRLAFIPQENPRKASGRHRRHNRLVVAGNRHGGRRLRDHRPRRRRRGAAQRRCRHFLHGRAALRAGRSPDRCGAALVRDLPRRSQLHRTGLCSTRQRHRHAGRPARSRHRLCRSDFGVGYLFPLSEFERAGPITGPDTSEAFFGRVFFAGGYQQAMQAMAEGLVDAAGASQYADLLLAPDQQSQVIWIAESEPIPSHLVIARPGLDADVQAATSRAFSRPARPRNRRWSR